MAAEDQAAMERIRERIAERNPRWAKAGISDAAVIRHCLRACDEGEKDDG